MNLGELFKQAKDVQARAEAMQAQLATIEIDGIAGGGMVRVVLNGKGELKRVAIDPSLLKPEDAQVVQDLLVAAHADAKTKVERRVADEMKQLAGSLGLPPGLGFG